MKIDHEAGRSDKTVRAAVNKLFIKAAPMISALMLVSCCGSPSPQNDGGAPDSGRPPPPGLDSGPPPMMDAGLPSCSGAQKASQTIDATLNSQSDIGGLGFLYEGPDKTGSGAFMSINCVADGSVLYQNIDLPLNKSANFPIQGFTVQLTLGSSTPSDAKVAVDIF